MVYLSEYFSLFFPLLFAVAGGYCIFPVDKQEFKDDIEQKKANVLKKLEEGGDFEIMMKDDCYFEDKEFRLGFDAKNPSRTLTVIVGESGIGKTTEALHYARQLKENQFPVIFYEAKQKENWKFPNFLNETFGIDDKDMIKMVVRDLKKQGKTSTLIIDNIQLMTDSSGKIDKTLLRFLNATCYQALEMSVIMISSVHESAYEIERCMFFHSLKLLYLDD